jgi:hypothetical protein
VQITAWLPDRGKVLSKAKVALGLGRSPKLTRKEKALFATKNLAIKAQHFQEHDALKRTEEPDRSSQQT